MRIAVIVLAAATLVAAAPPCFSPENTPTYQATVINATPAGQVDASGPARYSPTDASIPDPGATAQQQLRASDFEAAAPQRDWAADIRIGEVAPIQGGRMSLDHSENGYLYCAQYSPTNAPQCTVNVFRSIDSGLTWARYFSIRNAAGDDTLQDAVLRVGPGANPWIYILCHYATSAGALKLYRIRADLTDEAFYNIIRGDSVTGQIDLDRNIENPNSLFMTYVENRGSSQMLRLFASYDSGQTWTGGRSVASGDPRTPRVCAGGDGHVYLVYTLADTIIQVGRYTSNLVSPTYVFNFLDTAGSEDSYVPSVAASRTQAGAGQSAWILNRHLHPASSAYDVHVSYTTDGGTTWTTSYWEPCGGIVHSPEDFRAPYLRVSYDYGVDLVSAVATLYTAPESLVFAWSPATDPGTWNDRGIINEQWVTGQHSAGVDNTGATGGAVVTWREQGTGVLWSDYWYNVTGVEQASPAQPGFAVFAGPNPVRNGTSIRYSLGSSSRVTLAVYDLLGNEVRQLVSTEQPAGDYRAAWDGRDAAGRQLANGVYLVRLAAGSFQATKKLVLQQ